MINKLSICIPTLNREKYIGQTLDSIVCQIEADVDVVIVDGGSTDGTEKIINQYQKSYPFIRYIKSIATKNKPSNEGFDRDCNYAVEQAQGDYCWLMTDDDLLKPGAIKKIQSEIQNNYALIIVNTELCSNDLSEVLIDRRLDVSTDRTYAPNEWNDFAADVGGHLTFVGAVIIKKTLWQKRDKEKYFGSGFIHVGTIFDEPITENILVSAEPCVSVRYGNALWSSRAFEIWMFNWPDLIESFKSISEIAKRALSKKEPWRNVKGLFTFRALGAYSTIEYRKYLSSRLQGTTAVMAYLIGIFPATLANIICMFYFGLQRNIKKSLIYDLLTSRYASFITRLLAQLLVKIS